MKMKVFNRILKFLTEEGNYKLANKLLKATKTGRPAKLLPEEGKIMSKYIGDEGRLGEIISGRGVEISRSMGKGVHVRKGAYWNKRNPQDFGRSVFTEHKKMPIMDVDFNDPLSHHASQVTHQTLKDFQPALLDFLKTPGGKNAALKVYRTPAGMRIMDVGKAHRGLKPEVFEGAMQELGGDPYFANAAKVFNSYNARAMPKPGRVHNIWGLPGNSSTRLPDWHLKNPGDFIAKQVKKDQVFMGKNAEIDPRSWDESLFHDALIKQVIDRSRTKGIVQADNLLDLATAHLK
tara:strand:- start:2905 stop:3777 length:873 start_codon:yes stop_codon:yes gene_type:complete